jgi:hypothetical protein
LYNAQFGVRRGVNQKPWWHVACENFLSFGQGAKGRTRGAALKHCNDYGEAQPRRPSGGEAVENDFWCKVPQLYPGKEDRSVTKKICLLTMLLLVALAAGCSTHNAQNTDQNAATAAASPVPAPDNSEITTSVDASGTRTETRTFRNNPNISKVVVTTRDGKRTVRAYSPSGEEREVNTDENVLEATGDAVAKSAGFIADKGEDVAGETKAVGEEVADKAEDVGDKAKKVGEKAVDTTKDAAGATKEVGEKAVDKSKNVGEKTVEVTKKAGEKGVEGAKKVGEKTVEGAKKAGSAVKKVIP